MTKIKSYKKDDGKTYYMFNVYLGIDPITGKKKRTTRRGFTSRHEAKIALNKLTLELAEQGPNYINNYTFEDVYNLWIEQHKKEIRITTYKAIISKFKAQILPKFGSMKINTIKTAHCQDVINEWSETMNTFQDYKIQLNLVFKYALKHGIIEKNPLDLVSMPKRPQELQFNDIEENSNFYTQDQLETFLELLEKKEDYKVYTMFRLLAFTGCRKGELLSLHWSDINFDDATISIKKNLAEYKSKKLLHHPKTMSSRRIISIDRRTLEVLEQWKIKQLAEYATVGLKVKQDKKQPLFTRYYPNEHEMKYIRLAFLNDKLQSFLKRHPSLPKITVHGFRHTHASLLFELGLDIKEIQERLGHSDINTTMNIYTHLTHSAKKRAAKKIEEFVDF